MKFAKWVIYFTYSIGILLDAYASVSILKNYVYGVNEKFIFSKDIGSAFALMLGWTFLLGWAILKPLERKGVLLLTAIPVLLMLGCNNYIVLYSGIVTWSDNGINLVGSVFLIILFTVAYFLAPNLGKKNA
ncbi:MAG: hypothetical protein LDL51_09130 [Chloroflexi bacterium]|nr:hypothetical protein [Chloroflexota bacterium]